MSNNFEAPPTGAEGFEIVGQGQSRTKVGLGPKVNGGSSVGFADRYIQNEEPDEKEGELTLIDDPEWSAREKSFGRTEGDQITVQISGRHPMDILRTVAHELSHWENDDKDGSTGSDDENRANADAGEWMRNLADENPGGFIDESPSRDYKKAEGFETQVASGMTDPGTCVTDDEELPKLSESVLFGLSEQTLDYLYEQGIIEEGVWNAAKKVAKRVKDKAVRAGKGIALAGALGAAGIGAIPGNAHGEELPANFHHIYHTDNTRSPAGQEVMKRADADLKKMKSSMDAGRDEFMGGMDAERDKFMGDMDKQINALDEPSLQDLENELQDVLSKFRLAKQNNDTAKQKELRAKGNELSNKIKSMKSTQESYQISLKEMFCVEGKGAKIEYEEHGMGFKKLGIDANTSKKLAASVASDHEKEHPGYYRRENQKKMSDIFKNRKKS